MQHLKCCHQEYEWGKIGYDSLVGKMVMKGNHFDGRKEKSYTFDEAKPYAELWMGTHNNGPSFVYDPAGNKIVNSLLEYAHQMEGTDYNLPFLFKCLSVKKALSIQTHPTKEQAVLLHARDPKNYPDDNHKPEMAIAVTNFEILCGFSLWYQIAENLSEFPEVTALINNAPNDNKTLQLKETFTSIWTSPPEKISFVVKSIIDRISHKRSHSKIEALMLRLNDQFPGGDVGVLAPIFMNHVELLPGQAVYLGANIPHAYLFGDCIECMACSDNTIRAGLTPKFKDVTTLCEYMNWHMGCPPYVTSADNHDSMEHARRVYKIDTQEEFMISKWEPANISQQKGMYYSIRLNNGSPSIWVILRGNGTFIQDGDFENIEAKTGDVVFKPSFVHVVLLVSHDFLAYSAQVPNLENGRVDYSEKYVQKLEKVFRENVSCEENIKYLQESLRK